MVIVRLVRCLGCVPLFPIFQKMQIVRQCTEAHHFVLSELSDMGAFRLVGCLYRLTRFVADTEVSRQFLRRFVATEIEQPCHKVDYIPLGSASETGEIILIQLHARMPVMVERAASHTVAAHFQLVVFSGLLYRNSRLDAFVDRHNRPPS